MHAFVTIFGIFIPYLDDNPFRDTKHVDPAAAVTVLDTFHLRTAINN